MIYFTSDLHLGHGKAIDFCGRPFESTELMDWALIDNWNKRVKPDDTIFCLGDLSFHRPGIGVPLLKYQLEGEKILIRGNHDKYSDKQYREAGFKVYEELKIRFQGTYFVLSHYPYWDENENEDVERRYPERRPIDQGNYLLCGHVHRKWVTKNRQINVGVDVWDYKPVSFSQIISLIS
jgi:calcineurin-like phosphoesterase family protein